MKIDTQRLRSLTTGRLHTEIGHVYEDLETIIGETGLMTHMLPRVNQAVKPWLEANATDPRLWDGQFDRSHTGETELPEPTKGEREAMFARFKEMPSPLAGKEVIVAEI